jgi:hypothetical protein
MFITKRLAAIIASGLALAATPEASAWKTPRPASSLMPDKPVASVPPPPQRPDQPETTVQPSPVAPTPRELVVFALGFALATAAAVGIWLLRGADSSPAHGKPKTNAAAPRPVALATRPLATCPIEPAAAAASEKDGHFPLQADVSGLIAADIASFIVIGKEAVAAGRARDAEAAFLMSCRVADKLRGAASVESADAKYHLGAHYARLALDGDPAAGANHAELLRRAEPLHLDSLQTYIANYGEAHETSRLAAEGLAALRQTLAQEKSMQPAPEPVLAPERKTNAGALEKMPKPALPGAGAGAALTVSPLPVTEAEIKTSEDPSILKKCPEAVATLGLCNPAN